MEFSDSRDVKFLASVFSDKKPFLKFLVSNGSFNKAWKKILMQLNAIGGRGLDSFNGTQSFIIMPFQILHVL